MKEKSRTSKAHPRGRARLGSPSRARESGSFSFAAAEEKREQQYWVNQIYTALISYVVAALVFLAYALLTWPEPNRGLLIVLASAVLLVVVPPLYGLRYRIAAFRHRMIFFYHLSGATFVLVAWVCYLDGGLGSPSTWLFFLPLLYAGLVYPPLGVLLCGLVGLACYLIVGGLNYGSEPVPTFLLQSAMLGLGIVLAVVAARGRKNKDTELHHLSRRLELMASTDMLTGCLNHQAFIDSLAREVERSWRYGHVLSLLVIDVDHFKSVNDRHGHVMGNDVLRELGYTLRQATRQNDTAGRVGGDEFCLLAPETAKETAHTLAVRLRDSTAELPLPVTVSISIGIASLRPESKDWDVVLRSADKALYDAKHSGRNLIRLAD